MLTKVDIQQPKKRIGRTRFLLEFIVAMAILKVSKGDSVIPTLVLGIGLFLAFWLNAKRLLGIRVSEWWVAALVTPIVIVFIYGLICSLNGVPRPDDTINTNMMPIVIVDMVIPVLVMSLGFSLAIWASVKRLRDINKSIWWASIILAAFPFGIVLGLTGLPAPGSSGDILFKVVGGLYGVAYLAYLGILIFKPSAYPQVAAPSTEPNQPLSESSIQEALSVSDQITSRLGRLTGWQRIGILLSALWCFVGIGLSANDYYKTYSYYSFRVDSEARRTECLDKARKGPSPEKSVQECLRWGTETEVTGLPMPEKPSLPPVLPIFALIFLPITVGWFVAFFAKWATNWIREGFKNK